MDILNAFLNFTVLAAVVIGGLLLKGYLPGYAREKGKNLATKEDIEAITDKVEAVKNQHAASLEAIKAKLQLESALKNAFQQKSLEAISEINDLLVEITLHCWREFAERSPNEHYVWDSVDESDKRKGFHYFRVAIDKAALVHGLYLTQGKRGQSPF